jgi:zinc transport system permease protein
MPLFLQRALIAGVVSSILCAFVGVFVVTRKMAFFANAVAHSSLTGIAIGFLANTNPFGTAIGFGALVGVGIIYLYRKSLLFIDTIIGIFLPTSMALGIILIGFVKGYKPSLLSYLFGDILAVTKSDLYIISILSLISLLFLGAFFQEIIVISLDEDWAHVKGMAVNPIDYAFFVILSLIIVVSTKIVGIILVSALIVIPPASAMNIAKNFRQTMIYSVMFGITSAVIGIWLSYIFNISTGPSIVVTAGLIFIITLILRRKR